MDTLHSQSTSVQVEEEDCLPQLEQVFIKSEFVSEEEDEQEGDGTLADFSIAVDVPPTFSCDVCDKKFRHWYSLEEHSRCHSDAARYQCDLCDKSFVHCSSLCKHKAFVHAGMERLSCDRCGKRFQSNFILGLHIKQVHEGLKNHPCHLCKRRFTRGSNLAVHLLKRHAASQRPETRREEGAFEGSLIAQEASTSDLSVHLLKRHATSERPEEGAFEGSVIVHKASKGRGSKAQRKRASEKAEEWFTCVYCGYGCESQLLLNAHAMAAHRSYFERTWSRTRL